MLVYVRKLYEDEDQTGVALVWLCCWYPVKVGCVYGVRCQRHTGIYIIWCTAIVCHCLFFFNNNHKQTTLNSKIKILFYAGVLATNVMDFISFQNEFMPLQTSRLWPIWVPISSRQPTGYYKWQWVGGRIGWPLIRDTHITVNPAARDLVWGINRAELHLSAAGSSGSRLKTCLPDAVGILFLMAI